MLKRGLPVVLALGLGGCGITAAQRTQLIDLAVAKAGDFAEAKAKELLEKGIAVALEEAKKTGISAEDLALLEKKLREEGAKLIEEKRAEAEALAKAEADKRLPPAEPEGGGWLGKLLGLAVTAVLNGVAAGVVRKA